MAQLFFRYGAMNSGKTIEILKVAHNYEEQNKKLAKQNAELSNTIKTEKEQCSNPVKVAIFSFIVGLVSGIIITITTRKKNG